MAGRPDRRSDAEWKVCAESAADNSPAPKKSGVSFASRHLESAYSSTQTLLARSGSREIV